MSTLIILFGEIGYESCQFQGNASVTAARRRHHAQLSSQEFVTIAAIRHR